MKPTADAGSRIGGHMDELGPGPYILLSSLRLRVVSLTIARYTGIGHHYHVGIHEYDDFIWSNDVWVSPWDLPSEYRGFNFNAKFKTHQEAKDCIIAIVKERFTGDGYEIRNNHCCDDKWWYGEGD